MRGPALRCPHKACGCADHPVSGVAPAHHAGMRRSRRLPESVRPRCGIEGLVPIPQACGQFDEGRKRQGECEGRRCGRPVDLSLRARLSLIRLPCSRELMKCFVTPSFDVVFRWGIRGERFWMTTRLPFGLRGVALRKFSRSADPCPSYSPEGSAVTREHR